MRVLLINQTFFPDCAATAQYLTDLSLELVRSGAQVTVLTGRRAYLSEKRHAREEQWRGIRIIRVWPYSFRKAGRLSRIINAFCVNTAFALRLFSLPKFDAVVVLTTPPMIAWVALWYTRIRGGRLIHWVMDINPDQAFQAGWIRARSLFGRLLRRAQRCIYRGADELIVLDDFMRSTVLRSCSELQRVAVEPLWWDPDELEPVPHAGNPFREEQRLCGKFVVMYSGNFSVVHPLDTMLEAAALLADDPETVFMFIGGGARLSHILQFKEQHSLPNLVHLPYQDRARLKYTLSSANLHVVSLGSSFEGLLHPSKIYGILGVARPFVLLGSQDSAIGGMIRSSGLGWCVPHGAAEKLAAIIRELKQLGPAELADQEAALRELARPYERSRVVGGLVNRILTKTP